MELKDVKNCFICLTNADRGENRVIIPSAFQVSLSLLPR